MDFIFLTDKGKVRPHNEDSGGIFRSSTKVLAVVADGMGGHQAGDIASEMTVQELQRLWEESNLPSQNPEQAETWLKESVKAVNEKVFEHSLHNESCKGMGTTLVVAICTDEFITVGHIGDSRCYISNSTGFSQITDDHSLVNELVRSGQISREDAEAHPRKNVLMRALGTEKTVSLDVKTITWDEKDSILLCSDGLSNKVGDDELKEILEEDISLEEKATIMIQRANDLGGEDNISVAIIEFSSPVNGGSE